MASDSGRHADVAGDDRLFHGRTVGHDDVAELEGEAAAILQLEVVLEVHGVRGGGAAEDEIACGVERAAGIGEEGSSGGVVAPHERGARAAEIHDAVRAVRGPACSVVGGKLHFPGGDADGAREVAAAEFEHGVVGEREIAGGQL